MKLFFLFIIIIVFTACTDLQKPKQLQAIQSMNKTLDSIQKVVTSNPLDSANEYSILSQGVELRIKNNYFADTINMELGKKMDAYKVMRRKWAPLGYDYRNLLAGVTETKESLRQLKHDIDNGDGDRGKYNGFISFEKSKVDQLNELSKQYIDSRAETFKTFNELHQELDAFSQELVKRAEAKRK
ncbi:MAG: hypothetical protein KJ941_11880 [Bacteroidetes bacterium]|nr:hypothetical protein [Bacteroidota bacterium]